MLNKKSNTCEKVQVDFERCLEHGLFFEATSQLCVEFKTCESPVYSLDRLTNECNKNPDTLQICEL